MGFRAALDRAPWPSTHRISVVDSGLVVVDCFDMIDPDRIYEVEADRLRAQRGGWRPLAGDRGSVQDCPSREKKSGCRFRALRVLRDVVTMRS